MWKERATDWAAGSIVGIGIGAFLLPFVLAYAVVVKTCWVALVK